MRKPDEQNNSFQELETAPPVAGKRSKSLQFKLGNKTKGKAGKPPVNEASKKTEKSPKSTPTSNKMHVRIESKSEKRTRGRTPSPRGLDEKPTALDKKPKSTLSFKNEPSSSKELKRDEALSNMENEETSISLPMSDMKPEGHLQSDAALAGKAETKKRAEKKTRSTSKSPTLNIKSHARAKSASSMIDIMRTLTQSKTSSVSCHSQDLMSSPQTGPTTKEGTSNNSTNEHQAPHSPASVSFADSQTHNDTLNAARPVSPPLKKHSHMPDMRSVGKTIMSSSRTVKSAPVRHGHKNKGGGDRLKSISPGLFDKLLAKAKNPTSVPVEEASSADAKTSPSLRFVPHVAEGTEESQGPAGVEPADAALTDTIETIGQKKYQIEGSMAAEFACVEDEGRDERESTSRSPESALEFPSVMSYDSDTRDDTEGSIGTDLLMFQAHELLNIGISEI